MAKKECCVKLEGFPLIANYSDLWYLVSYCRSLANFDVIKKVHPGNATSKIESRRNRIIPFKPAKTRK